MDDKYPDQGIEGQDQNLEAERGGPAAAPDGGEPRPAAEPVKEAAPDEPPADIRLTGNSDDVIALSATPANIARMWLSGRVKVQASMRDLLALRKLL